MASGLSRANLVPPGRPPRSLFPSEKLELRDVREYPIEEVGDRCDPVAGPQ